MNRTPFLCNLIPGLDKEGRDYITVVVKGTFVLNESQRSLSLGEEQNPLVLGDQYHGKPATSSVKYEAETCLTKPGTDVVLVGHAYAKGKAKSSVDVSVKVGPIEKRLRIFGDRYWERSLLSFRPTDPAPFERMPICYENAYGGSSPDPDAGEIKYDVRNPVGKGYYIGEKGLEGQPLPNLEDPKSLISSWKDRPAPAGLGYFGRAWLPRMRYAGSYDEQWQKTRAPLLPHDFDARYFNGAHPDMIAYPHLKGGEVVSLENVADGHIHFALPKTTVDIKARIKGTVRQATAKLDTVLIEPDDRFVSMIWRAALPCYRSFLYVDWIKVSQKN